MTWLAVAALAANGTLTFIWWRLMRRAVRAHKQALAMCARAEALVRDADELIERVSCRAEEWTT